MAGGEGPAGAAPALSHVVELRRAAELDIAEAQLWYEMQSVGLGRKFYAAICRVLDRLAENPRMYQLVYRDVRRAVVHRFPYLIWYRVTAKKVTILACTDGRQAPGRALARLH